MEASDVAGAMVGGFLLDRSGDCGRRRGVEMFSWFRLCPGVNGMSCHGKARAEPIAADRDVCKHACCKAACGSSTREVGDKIN